MQVGAVEGVNWKRIDFGVSVPITRRNENVSILIADSSVDIIVIAYNVFFFFYFSA